MSDAVTKARMERVSRERRRQDDMIGATIFVMIGLLVMLTALGFYLTQD